MSDWTVPWSPRGLDFEMFEVGRPCISPRALAVSDLIHHQVQRRRITGHAVAYQPGDTELGTPGRVGSATIPNHRFYYYTGPNTRFVRVTIWTLGAVVASGTPFITVATSTDPVGVTTARVIDAAAPGTTIDEDELQVFESVPVEVTPGGAELVELIQNSSSSPVRILSAIVHELPIGKVDSTADAVYVNLYNFEPGTDIVDTENDDLVIAQNRLRRQHKKLLFSCAREFQVTDVGGASRRDILTWSSGNPPASRGQWNMYQSVNLPETATVSVTCVALGRATAGTGSVVFSFSGGSVTVGGFGALSMQSQTSTVAKVSDTLSLEAYISDPGTFYGYGCWVYENWEAA